MNRPETTDSAKMINDLLISYKAEVLGKVPYRVNLVDILGADENAHTRILTAILDYERGGKHPFVASFISRFVVSVSGENPLEVVSPKVEMQRSYIDALIWEKSKYAIIIENKINWAVDQKKQIERYIRATKELYGDNSNGCYVIYLTDDGRKKISDFSLTEKAKQFLGCSDDNPGRYIELNYKEDILAWIKEDVIGNCRYMEKSLISMLEQYIDYLEHRFSIGAVTKENCFGKFVDSKLGGDEKDRFNGLRSWYNCVAGNTKIDADHKYAIAPFAAQVQNELTKMVNINYSLDYEDAASKKGATIRVWAKAKGFKPRKWYNSTYFEFVVGPNSERIKFQIDVDDKSNKVWVRFFNNDFKDDGQHQTIALYEGLTTLFHNYFPNVIEEEQEKICSTFGEYNSELELQAALSGRVYDFLVAFSKTFTA